MNKNFFVALLLIIVFCFSLQNSYMFQKTRNNKPFESFKTETSKVLPFTLSNYLLDSDTRYYIYKLPNYVIDFLTYDKEFSITKSSNDKFVVFVFTKEFKKTNTIANYSNFYQKVKDLQKEYSRSYILVERNETIPPKYKYKYDTLAYKDFREHCSAFCLIDPFNNTMFGFKDYSISDAEALEVLFQNYDDFLRNK